ncbi:MAG: hypothetical protein ABJN26_10360 [Stappiaceae bacterium]
MTRDDYEKRVVKYGPDSSNWPESDKHAWHSFQNRFPEKAARLVQQEQDFTNTLQEATSVLPSLGLSTRITAGIASRDSQALSIRKLLIGGGLTTITSTIAGVMLALSLDVNMLDYPLEGDVATTMLIEPNLIWTEE